MNEMLLTHFNPLLSIKGHIYVFLHISAFRVTLGPRKMSVSEFVGGGMGGEKNG